MVPAYLVDDDSIFSSGDYPVLTGEQQGTMETENATTTTKEYDSSTETEPVVTSVEQDTIYHIMAVVVGTVFLMIVIIVIVFVFRSRRRRRLNLEVYSDRQQRPATIALELIDREHHSQEGVNGVHQLLYGQDTRLPITSFHSPGHPGQATSQRSDTSLTPQDTDYENNDVILKPNITPVYDFPKQIIVSSKKGDKRLNCAEVKVENVKDSDYEKAFTEREPKFNDNKGANKPNQKAKTADTLFVDNEIQTEKDKSSGNQQQKRATTADTRQLNLETPIKSGKGAQPGAKSIKEQPKQIILSEKHKLDHQSKGKMKNVKENKDENESPEYENSLAKIKRAKFHEAKLLKTVPPPCNTKTHYVNVPGDEQMSSASKTSLRRQSSEYENPDIVNDLKKQEECKPDYANIAVQGGQDSHTLDNEPYDYENSDTVNELKLTLNKMGKRGFSTSSLDSRRLDMNGKTGLTKSNAKTGFVFDKENDDMYLPMDLAKENDEMYLAMDYPVDDDEYMPMEQNYSYPKSDSTWSKTSKLHSHKTKDHSLAKGYLTAPKACGEASNSGYVNFSDPPSKYVNFFRSRSIDDIYMYADSRTLALNSKKDDKAEIMPRR